jgi:hypothetical protein
MMTASHVNGILSQISTGDSDGSGENSAVL